MKKGIRILSTIHLSIRHAPAAAWAYVAHLAGDTIIKVAEPAHDASMAGPCALRRIYELIQSSGEHAEVIVHDPWLLAQIVDRRARWSLERAPFPGPLDAGGWGEVRRLDAEDGFRLRFRQPEGQEVGQADRLSTIMDFAAAGAPYQSHSVKGPAWEDVLKGRDQQEDSWALDRVELAKRLFWAEIMLSEDADRIPPDWRDKWWQESAEMPMSGPEFLRKWLALADAALAAMPRGRIQKAGRP